MVSSRAGTLIATEPGVDRTACHHILGTTTASPGVSTTFTHAGCASEFGRVERDRTPATGGFESPLRHQRHLPGRPAAQMPEGEAGHAALEVPGA